MRELVVIDRGERHYVCDLLREYSTDPSYINGEWIAHLTLKRDDHLVYAYHRGVSLDEMDGLDREVCTEIIADYN
ncbi:hypothetical protein [Streptococcus parasanguinis]|uniref:hypothetical protein n=1 Tax=Streptococcus parasanguinis TaxID=1318 RepID=UPI00321AE5DA